MSVALFNVDMLKSEIITVYFALAAPVGVTRYLRRDAREGRPRAALVAACAALVWPLALVRHALASRRRERGRGGDGALTTRERKVDAARRALVAALHGLEDEARSVSLAQPAGAAHDACSRVERYAGLALALEAAQPDGEPAAHETETARVSGRTGEDLRVAGRCVRRRNVARLALHQRRARHELLHALADLPDSFASPLEGRAPDAHASRRLYAALLPAHTRAIELFRLFDDAPAAQAAARLFDSAAARVRLLAALDRQASQKDSESEEPCTHTPHPDTESRPTRAA